jgi:fructose-1,6-bisphosphatase/sedoheptulose 1,7-bisphosphatase-like protein
MCSSSTRFSINTRALEREEVALWNARNRRLLKGFGLTITEIEELELRPARRFPADLELVYNHSASLAAALPVVALALKGRGDLLLFPPDKQKALKTQYKEAADLRAAATELEVFHSIVEENTNVAFLVRVGEGGGEAGRRKPGEGLNASLYPGQLIVHRQHLGKTVEDLERQGVKVFRIATDPIDGTTKTVMDDYNALTAVLIVDGEIKSVPDLYMEKLTMGEDAANSGLDTGESLPRIVQGLSDSYRSLPSGIDVYHLERVRHPTDQLIKLGVCVCRDSDGDLLPMVAPGVKPGVLENDQPLAAMVGEIGGAAEFLVAGAPIHWTGGAAHGRFVSAAGIKKGWEGRLDFTPEEIAVIEGAGFIPGKNYPISALVDLGDGLAAFGAITSHDLFPQLKGAFIGANFVHVDVLTVGASGRVIKRHFEFKFMEPREKMIESFNPVSEVLMHCDLQDIRGELRKILDDDRLRERLHREIGLSLYQVFDINNGKFAVNDEKLAELGDERTREIINNLMNLKPDWFA